MTDTWFILYGGYSSDGRGPGDFLGRTTDPHVAREHFVKTTKNPYSTGSVRIITDTTIRTAVSETDFMLPDDDGTGMCAPTTPPSRGTLCFRYNKKGRPFTIKPQMVCWSGDTLDGCSVCEMDIYNKDFDKHHKQ